MMSIQESIIKLVEEVGPSATLIAVSKTKANKDIMSAYDIGQRNFGENKVQELVDKYEALPKDIKWHFIGHLQRNKVKYITSFVGLIHSVDSIKLLKEINKRAANDDRVVDCLLQLSIAKENTKFGLSFHALKELIESKKYKEYNHVNICGLMGMATNTKDVTIVHDEFAELKKIFDQMRTIVDSEHFNILSMGMTNDYKIALIEGSNMLRIGSLIFGKRTYS